MQFGRLQDIHVLKADEQAIKIVRLCRTFFLSYNKIMSHTPN